MNQTAQRGRQRQTPVDQQPDLFWFRDFFVLLVVRRCRPCTRSRQTLHSIAMVSSHSEAPLCGYSVLRQPVLFVVVITDPVLNGMVL